MNHDEFTSSMMKGAGVDTEYYVPELNSGEWVGCRYLSRILNSLDLNPSSWYGRYVPNPGCSVCSYPVLLAKDRISNGWSVTCGSESCRTTANSKSMTSRNIEYWKDPEYRERMYELRSAANIKNWNDETYRSNLESKFSSPEVAKSRLIEFYTSKGITHSHVYIGKSPEFCKFGVSVDPDGRCYNLGLELVCTTKSLPVDVAVDIEFLISSKVPKDLDIEISGKNEIRSLGKLDLIISILNDLEVHHG